MSGEWKADGRDAGAATGASFTIGRTDVVVAGTTPSLNSSSSSIEPLDVADDCASSDAVSRVPPTADRSTACDPAAIKTDRSHVENGAVNGSAASTMRNHATERDIAMSRRVTNDVPQSRRGKQA